MQRHVRLCLTVLALSVLVALFATQVGAQPLRDGLPEEVGMSSERLENVFRVVEQGVVQGAYPGAEILVVRKGVVVAHRPSAMRSAFPSPGRWRGTSSTSPPCRSSTATAVMMLVERGYIRLMTRSPYS